MPTDPDVESHPTLTHRGPEATEPDSARKPRTARLVSWNVQGRALDDPLTIATRLDELGADIVCFQEVQRAQFRVISAHSPVTYGEWWFKHWTVRYPAEGLATASRWPVAPAPGMVPLSHRWRWFHYTRRIASGARVQTPDGPIDVWNTHLSSDRGVEQRANELRHMTELMPSKRSVLAGDLNARPGSRELALVRNAGWRDGYDFVHPTIPAMTNLTDDRLHLKQRLDYVMVSGDLRVVDAQVPGGTEPFDTAWWALSDHLPVVVDLNVAATASSVDGTEHRPAAS